MKPLSRLSIGLAIQLVAILFSLMSWTDPLEGGVALTLATGITGLAYAVGRVRIPKLTWISSLAGLGIMVLFWVLYIAEIPEDPSQLESFQPSATIMTLLWVYRVASIAFISGVIFYAVLLFTARRALPPTSR